MATYYVQPVKDKQNRVGGWEVAKKHGRGTTPESDHKFKSRATDAAKKMANKGDNIAIKDRNGSFLRWVTK